MLSDVTNLYSQLWNCEHAFSTLCPKKWSDLTSTKEPGIRYCEACDQDVTYCTTPDEFVELGNAGRCVAIPDQHRPASLARMLLGKPSVNAMKSIQIRQKETAAWWNEAVEHGPEFASAAFDEVLRLAKAHRLDSEALSDDRREYLMNLKLAIENGPEALYLFVRTKANGKRDNQQNIFRTLRSHFDLTFRECREIAGRMDAENPE